VLVHLVHAIAAYPFGVLSDHIDRRLQLGIGAIILICASSALAAADTLSMTVIGAALWGLQLAVTQGLLSASVADAAPEHLRGTAFGIYELALGVATFVASTAAGVLWMVGGPSLTFSVSAMVAAAAVVALLLRPMPNSVAPSS
jgi:MFS family permease